MTIHALYKLSLAPIMLLCLTSSVADQQWNLTFEQSPANRPVLGSGTSSTPMFVMDSCVLQDRDGYHLFFSSFFAEAPGGLSLHLRSEIPENRKMPKLTTAIAYAYSKDQGLTWQVRETPILVPSEDGWDSGRVETANAVVHNQTLYVFYCADGVFEGKPFTSRYQIGVATLNLGGASLHEQFLKREAVLKKEPLNPILPHVTTKSSFLNNVQEPSVIWKNGCFELYFVGLRLKRPDLPINAAEQGITEVGLGRAVLNPTLKIQTVTQAPLLKGVNIVEVREFKDRYLLFSTAAGEGEAHQGERIEAYESVDGIAWSGPFPILDKPQPTGFESWARMSPTFVSKDDFIVLFYTALEVSRNASTDRWGLPLGNGARLFASLGRAVFYPKMDR